MSRPPCVAPPSLTCLLADDLSARTNATTRSLRELRTWTDELASTGIRILGNDGSTGSKGDGTNPDGVSGGGTALHHRDRQDKPDLLADLEGGSRGGAVGAIPFLMVGTKEDVGEGVRRDGARLASELGMGHVAVVSQH